MDCKLVVSACLLGVLLMLWQSEAAPVDGLSDREQLRRTLYRLDTVLDELIRRTEDSHTSYKRNEDGSLPYKRNEDGHIPYRRNEDGSIPYKRNEDGSLPYRYLQTLHDQKRNEDGSLPYKRNEDGPVPYRTLKRANEEGKSEDTPKGYYASLLDRALSHRYREKGEDIASSDRTSENNLRKVLRYLAEMEDKLQKRDHDIPFPFVGRRSHEK